MKFVSLFIPKEGRLPKTWIAFFAINFIVIGLNRYVSYPMPISVFVEVFYLICIVNLLADNKYSGNASRMACTMLGLYSPWIFYTLLEVGNVSSEIEYGVIINRWFAEIRTIAFQIVYGMLICAALFCKKEQIKTMYKIWGLFVVFATAKTLIQQYIGFDNAEQIFLASARRTHFVNGIIRYFSFFSDAANYGCNMAATTAVFGAVALSCKLKKEKIFFAIVTCCALYGMLASGTRTGIFVLGVGGFAYACLSKRTSAIASTIIIGGAFFVIMAFTDIGQGNGMVRRMRSAFNKEDASMTVREVNQQAMKKYIDELPLGLGAGIHGGDIPPSNKYYFLSSVPPDSMWVYVNIRYGHLGKYIFLFSFFAMCLYGGYIVFFRVKDPELRGLLAGLTSGSIAMLIAGYANQIQLQYPNCYLFFGQLMIVYLGPDIDRRMQEEEKKKALEELNNPSQ